MLIPEIERKNRYLTTLAKPITITNNFITISAVWLLVLLYRYLTLQNFGFVYVDADQTVMWSGLLDYSSNTWHEPRFYGQNYNSMLEAFLAVPLYKLGVAPYIALPIITTLLCLSSYFLLVIESYRDKKYMQAFFIACLPLLLPIKYTLITSLPRGFLPGIFVASLAVFRSNPATHPKGSFRFGFLSVLSFSLNPNSAFLLIPFFVERATVYRRNLKLLKPFIVGLLLGIAVHVLAQTYYVLHPETIVHHLIGTEFHFGLFKEHIKDLDKIFNDVIPVFWNSGFFVLLLFPAMAFVLYRQNQKLRSLALLIFTCGLILSLGLGKTADGTTSVIFPYSRLYLALPLVLGIAFSWIKLNLTLKPYMLLVPVIFFCIHYIEYTVTIPNKYIKNDVIAVTKIYRLEKSCVQINTICKKNSVDLILIHDSYFKDIINYGCASCVSDFPNTLRTNYERRTWQVSKFQDTVIRNVLVIDVGRRLDLLYPKEVILMDSSIYLVKDNKVPTKKLIEKLKL